MNSTGNIKELRKGILPKVLIRFLSAFAFVGILIFVPAGTIHYFNGWLFVSGILLPMTFALIYFSIKDPELLEKRINLKEKEETQKKFVRFSLFLYVIAYVIPGLDYRFSWSEVPVWLVMVSLVLMIGGYLMFIIVMIQNRYASRIIEIQNEQKLIDKGLYSVVRHPMYLAATLLYLSSSLVLGSWYTLIPMSFLPVLLAYRIKNEEKVLLTGLPGYEEYTRRVKYRLIPFIW